MNHPIIIDVFEIPTYFGFGKKIVVHSLPKRPTKKTLKTTLRHPGLLGNRPLWPGSRHRPQGQQPSSRGETWWLGFKVASRIIASPIITTFLLKTNSQCHRPHHYHRHPHPHHLLHHDLHHHHRHPHHNDLLNLDLHHRDHPHHDDLIWKVLRLPSAATAHPSLRESLGGNWHNHNGHSKLSWAQNPTAFQIFTHPNNHHQVLSTPSILLWTRAPEEGGGLKMAKTCRRGQPQVSRFIESCR